MMSFDSILKLNGFPIAEAKKELKAVQSLRDEDFRVWKENKRESIIKFHFDNNPFYKKDVLRGTLPQSWDEVPILQKSDYQKDLPSLISTNFKNKSLRVHNTSGSSGHPFFFAKDRFCHAMTWAVIQNRYSWHDISLDEKQARFYGIPLSILGNYKEKTKDILSNRIRFPVFDLSDKVLEKFFLKFSKNPIRYIYGYTSSICLFAKFLISKNRKLQDVCPTLKLCIVTSEVCTPEDRITIEKAFGVKVVNEYGAAELDFIAFENKNSKWLVNSDSLFVEILDDNNIPVQKGESGKIVITSLYNKAMPFIRYEVGDYGILSKEQFGKYDILENLLGRTNDFAILPSGKKSPGLTFYYISKSILEKGSTIKEFIIRQTKEDTFIFEYVSSQHLNSIEIETIKRMMELYLEPGLNANFIKKEKIVRPSSGKLKHFYSEIL